VLEIGCGTGQLTRRLAGRALSLTAGYRPDYTGWIRFPVFDDLGFPNVDDNLSTSVPGLHFCGVHFLRTRRSSLLFGVGADAALLAKTIRPATSTRHKA